MPVKSEKDEVKQYVHDDQKRVNNPPVGLVTAETDHLNGKKTYSFDPHLDPQLQWAGKTEGLSFDVDTVSLHVHERIDPLTIIEAVRKKETTEQKSLFHYFETKENNPPIREAIEFYKHSQGWSNRLIAGDSLLVMNSLLEKEGMAGKVQMIYIDPPYGIKYGSNFQPFVNKREVKDGKDEDLTQEPETIKAFRDTWELGIHSYLAYLYNRCFLARELLSESGSIFIQINDQNLHHVREILDEVFGSDNLVSIITFKKTGGQSSDFLANISDYILWYAKNKKLAKCRSLFLPKEIGIGSGDRYEYVESPDGKKIRHMTPDEVSKPQIISKGWKPLLLGPLTSQGATSSPPKFTFKGKTYGPGPNQHWKTSLEGMNRLAEMSRIVETREFINYKIYLEDFPVTTLTNLWTDTMGTAERGKMYVVQTATKVVARCMLLTTDPGDLVFDPTCGSGTTTYVAEQWGRRWITCDTSRVAITLTKQRLMTAIFEYYELAHPKDGVGSGFKCKTVPHIMLSTIANNEPSQAETLFDQPEVDKSKKRVTGPFTVEAVPSQRVRSFEEVEKASQEADISISRSGETLRQDDWISEMLSTGIRGKGGQSLEFARIEPLGGTRWVHASGETKEGKTAVISFGPEYAPLEQKTSGISYRRGAAASVSTI